MLSEFNISVKYNIYLNYKYSVANQKANKPNSMNMITNEIQTHCEIKKITIPMNSILTFVEDDTILQGKRSRLPNNDPLKEGPSKR